MFGVSGSEFIMMMIITMIMIIIIIIMLSHVLNSSHSYRTDQVLRVTGLDLVREPFLHIGCGSISPAVGFPQFHQTCARTHWLRYRYTFPAVARLTQF
jgi:hypothetical protein